MTAGSSNGAWIVGVDGSLVVDEAVGWAVRHAPGRTARERGVDVEYRFVAGVPRDTLVTAAESADLLVVGKRGAGAIGAALLGSVSASVLATSTCRPWSCRD